MTSSSLTRTHGTALPWSPAAGVKRVRSRRVAIDLVGIVDVLGVVWGGFLAFSLSAIIFGTHFDASMRDLHGWLLTAFFSYLVLRHFGLYESEVVYDLPADPVRIGCAVLIALGVALGIGTYPARSILTLALTSAIWSVTATATIVLGRSIARRWLHAAAVAGSFDTRVAIYGTGALADRIVTTLGDPDLHCRFTGAYDDRLDGERHVSTAPGCLGGLDELIAAGREGLLDQIIIALPQSADHRTADIARRLEQLPVSLHIVTHISGDIVDGSGQHRVSSMGPIGLIDIKTKPFADWERHIKSAEDFVIGVVALIVALPVMAVVALAIKWDSPGPVIFRQRRHGLNRRPIEVLKFRSMSVMENGPAVQQATRNDARVTRVGAFLRKTSLDELPQLFNVLRGDMSLIGPRPHALVHDDLYGEMLERYANRHQVKPGMTGWAQINGFRGPTDTPDKMRARVEHDLAYIDNWSLWFDLRILWLTILRGFRHENAV